MIPGFTSRAYAALAAVAVLAANPSAQHVAHDFAEAQRANQAALRHFTWKSRTELRIDGEVKQVRLEQVRFALDGQLQKTAIGGESAATASRPTVPGPAGALKKRIVARKAEALTSTLADLAHLAESYAHLSPERRQTFASRAVASPDGAVVGALRLSGRDVVMPGDRLTAWIDPASGVPRRVEIATFHDGQAVTIATDYRRLPAGLTYQARSVLRYPTQGLDVTVETFDYEHASN